MFQSGALCTIFDAMDVRLAKFGIGQVVRHRLFPFRGVIFDVDPTFANTEEYWLRIPENARPHKDQPSSITCWPRTTARLYTAYVSEQNLLPDDSGEPVAHPHAALIFDGFRNGHYQLRPRVTH